MLRARARGRVEIGSAGKYDERIVYMMRVAPPAAIAQKLLAAWPDGDAAACRLSGSVAWARSRRLRDTILEWGRQLPSQLRGEASHAQWDETVLWAYLAVRACSLDLGGRRVVCPLLDLCSHGAIGPTACAVEVDDADGALTAVQLCANFTLSEGDDVSLRRDPDADFLDVFERHGVLDSTAVTHTAEVLASRASIFGNHAHLESACAWRVRLVDALAADGCDQALGDGGMGDAWWVPDHFVEGSPLVAAVRAVFVTESELQEALPSAESATDDDLDAALEVVRRPIARERAVRTRVVGLLTAHLDRLGSTARDDGEELAGRAAGLASREVMALRLAHFEKALLEGAVGSLKSAGSEEEEEEEGDVALVDAAVECVAELEEGECERAPCDVTDAKVEGVGGRVVVAK